MPYFAAVGKRARLAFISFEGKDLAELLRHLEVSEATWRHPLPTTHWDGVITDSQGRRSFAGDKGHGGIRPLQDGQEASGSDPQVPYWNASASVYALSLMPWWPWAWERSCWVKRSLLRQLPADCW